MKQLSVTIETRTNESVFGRLISRIYESADVASQYMLTSKGTLFLRNGSLRWDHLLWLRMPTSKSATYAHLSGVRQLRACVGRSKSRSL